MSRQVELQKAFELVPGGDAGLPGRQIALKKFPFQLPGNAASGPDCNAVVIGPFWNRAARIPRLCLTV